MPSRMTFHRAIPSHPKPKPNSTPEAASSTYTSTGSSITSSRTRTPSPKPSIFSTIFSSRSSRSNLSSTSSTSTANASTVGQEVEATGSHWVHPPLKYVNPPDQHHVELLARWAWEEDCRGARGLWEGRRRVGDGEREREREDVGPKGEKW